MEFDFTDRHEEEPVAEWESHTLYGKTENDDIEFRVKRPNTGKWLILNNDLDKARSNSDGLLAYWRFLLSVTHPDDHDKIEGALLDDDFPFDGVDVLKMVQVMLKDWNAERPTEPSDDSQEPPGFNTRSSSTESSQPPASTRNGSRSTGSTTSSTHGRANASANKKTGTGSSSSSTSRAKKSAPAKRSSSRKP